MLKCFMVLIFVDIKSVERKRKKCIYGMFMVDYLWVCRIFIGEEDFVYFSREGEIYIFLWCVFK